MLVVLKPWYIVVCVYLHIDAVSLLHTTPGILHWGKKWAGLSTGIFQ
uniref:Uncharacterized protein n=1 Tax=Anguilla anguilla TaxID=7936 RepID=A0A0E9V8G1_ANGAN